MTHSSPLRRLAASLFFATLPLAILGAAPTFPADGVRDSSRVVDLEEAVVVASPKEHKKLRNAPLSVSIFGEQDLSHLGATAVKGLTTAVPGLFIPDYGSRLTSAVYIRGVGSRINTPAVGLYVDNIPVLDKSAYDFEFQGVDRVDVLRGPQGTLYGRNSMGGLLRVFTKDPLRTKETTLTLGGTTRNGGRHIAANTLLQPAAGFGLSISGYYNGENGFFRNQTTGHHADGSEAGGGRLRLAWKPADDWRIDLHAAYEYADEGACPYIYNGMAATDNAQAEPYPDYVGKITSDNPSRYRRSLLTSGLNVEWRADRATLTSTTAVSHLSDRLFMDQDFIGADIFTLEQRQRLTTLTQELTLKSRGSGHWQRTTGLFAMYEALRTTCPVIFGADGIDYLNGTLAAVLPQQPPMSLTFLDTTLPFGATLRTPAAGAAAFHQSTIDLGKRWSLTAGLRLDYDHHKLDLRSATAAPVAYKFAMPAFHIEQAFASTPEVNGTRRDDTWQLLPKFGIKYELGRKKGNLFATVSKGYRSGGYNIQSYSELAEAALRRGMMTTVRDYCVETINRMPLPEASKQAAIAGMTAAIDRNTPAEPQIADLYYRPEQSWNYEAGAHLNFCGGALQVDAALFYMSTKDQQLAVFAEDGYGRQVTNSGKSQSCGAEFSMKGALLDDKLTLSGNYGFVHATFRGDETGYAGKRVPFIPAHTLQAAAFYRQPLSGSLVSALGAGIDVSGAGNIYWEENNLRHQPFYALLGARLTAEIGKNISLEIWGKNLTATRYDVFSFISMQRRYSQMGAPRHFGADLRLTF